MMIYDECLCAAVYKAAATIFNNNGYELGAQMYRMLALQCLGELTQEHIDECTKLLSYPDVHSIVIDHYKLAAKV